jgi:hypothetical protein
MKNYLEDAAEKLAEIYKQMICHTEDKSMNVSDMHLDSYLHIGFGEPENNVKEAGMEAQ